MQKGFRLSAESLSAVYGHIFLRFFVAFSIIFVYVCNVKIFNKMIRVLRPWLQDKPAQEKEKEAMPTATIASKENAVPQSRQNFEVLEDVLAHFSCQF